MASKSAEARRLWLQLSAETGVAVIVQWDSSAQSNGWQWHVIWPDGPTVEGMTALVDQLLPATSALDRTGLVYLRTVQPISVAMAIVRNLRVNLPPLGEYDSSWELEDHLRDVPYPERGTDSDAEVAAELLRLAPSGHAEELTDLASRYGFVGLRARLSPPANVLPFRRTRSR
jgi:hypothetical protein